MATATTRTCCEACGRPLADTNVARAQRLADATALTPRQRETLFTIARFRDERGVSPTIRELSELMATSTATVFECLGNMERKRVIVRGRGSRAITLARA